MDIHKPKSVHSWREFLTEIGTIICGILIALGLEQAIEALHSRHLVEQADRAMERELADDDGQQAYARIAISPCLSRQLNGLRAAIEGRVPPQAFGKLAAAYEPPARVWDDVAWKAAQSSGVVSRMGASKLEQWGTAYGMVPFLESHQEQEARTLKQLRRSRFKTGAWSQARSDELADLVDALVDENRSLTLDSAQQLFNTSEAGIVLAPMVQKTLLNEMRGVYGDCVVEPDRTAIHVQQAQGHTPEQERELMKRLTGH